MSPNPENPNMEPDIAVETAEEAMEIPREEADGEANQQEALEPEAEKPESGDHGECGESQGKIRLSVRISVCPCLLN